MQRKLVLFTLLLCGFNIFSQDSIVNYLDRIGKIIDKKNAIEIETVVRKDSLWKVTRYYRSGKLKQYGYFQDKDKKTPIGSLIGYHRNGNLYSVILYDSIGNKHGPAKRWFDNGSINFTGFYVNNEKESIWKYYHYNGNIACKRYFKNGGITKTVFYNEDGNKTEAELVEFKKPEYVGGEDKFKKRIQRLHQNIDFQVVGKIYLNFIIDIKGNITNVETNDRIPNHLKRQIKKFLESDKNWKPALHMNRKIPYNYTIPLNFSVVFNE